MIKIVIKQETPHSYKYMKECLDYLAEREEKAELCFADSEKKLSNSVYYFVGVLMGAAVAIAVILAL